MCSRSARRRLYNSPPESAAPAAASRIAPSGLIHEQGCRGAHGGQKPGLGPRDRRDWTSRAPFPVQAAPTRPLPRGPKSALSRTYLKKAGDRAAAAAIPIRLELLASRLFTASPARQSSQPRRTHFRLAKGLLSPPASLATLRGHLTTTPHPARLSPAPNRQNRSVANAQRLSVPRLQTLRLPTLPPRPDSAGLLAHYPEWTSRYPHARWEGRGWQGRVGGKEIAAAEA
ncbi:uncharacterized protein LOC143690844 [Tamandua tetradactyla]|uniref:uncharacterized protein LOC143690844 n=1 Tax=Tamandua tetradactyla TaxID=48850 RepID=UPI0040538821